MLKLKSHNRDTERVPTGPSCSQNLRERKITIKFKELWDGKENTYTHVHKHWVKIR